MFFRTVPPANTLVRWVNENAFVFIVQTRLCPPLADRFISGFPIDCGPVLLLMPFGFHLAMDTLPSGVLQVVASGPPWPVSGFRFRARLGFFRPSTFSGPRGITPAFGYSAPHSSARGTLTLLSNALQRTLPPSRLLGR